jgi:hypothetical protein
VVGGVFYEAARVLELGIWDGKLVRFSDLPVGLPESPAISRLDVICSTFFFQIALYVSVRLARRALTLGELVLIGHGATALFLETLNISIVKVCRFISS